MSLIAGVLAFSEGSVVLATDAPDHFNGGTPVLNDGSLCINSEAIQQPNAVGGQYYDPEGRLGTDPLGAVATYAGGLPLTAQGNVAVGFDTPTNWNAGIPITASGRMAISPGWGLDATGEQIRAAIRDITKYGESLGPELVSNGTFTSDVSGWTLNGGAHSWESGALRRTPTGATGSYQDVPTAVGQTYEFTSTRTLVSGAGTAGVYVYTGGGFAVNAGSATGAGTSSFRVTATSATTRVYLYTDGTRVADFDNISVKEVITGFLLPGTAGARINASARSSVAMERLSDGTYAYAPHNLLTYSDDLSNAAWVKSASLTVTANAAAAPNGTVTADLLYATANGGRSVYQAGGGGAVVSVYAKASGINWLAVVNQAGAAYAAWFNLTAGEVGTVAAGVSASISSVGNGWFRCVVASTTGAAFTFAQFAGTDADNVSTVTASGTNGILLWGAQTNLGPTALPYIPTTSAAVYAPAVSYSATDLEYGLQYEPSRTNLVTKSIEFDDAAWTKLRATVTGNSTTAPDGTTTADTLLDTAVAGTHVAIQTVTKDASSITYAASIFVKASTRDQGELRVSDQSGNGVRCTFNLTTVAIGAATAFGTGFTAVTAQIGQSANGWYRVVLVATSNTATTLGHETYVADASGNISYTGTGTGFFIWGAQLETGSVATSPILTYGSTVTRAADLPLIPNTVAGAIGSDMGTIAVDAVANVIGANGVVAANDASANNQVSLRSNNVAVVRLASSDVITPSIGTMVAGTRAKSAMSYQMREAAASRANSTAVSAGDNLGLTQIQLGGLDGGTSANGSGLIYRIRTSKNLLSNNQDQILAALKSLTA